MAFVGFLRGVCLNTELTLKIVMIAMLEFKR